LDVEVCTAREWLRVGRALEALPVVDAAFGEGRISYAKVRHLTRVATEANEAELVGIAERTPAGRLCGELARWQARREEPEDTEPSVTGWASVAQQRADALLALLHGGGAKVDTEVVLHVRGDGCTLDDGTPVAGSVVERVAPASLLRVLIHDAEGHPINASGRRRHPSVRQQRVVHERDRGCVDCGATTLLELDHEPAYALTGHTVIDELRERCWTCHRARHTTEGDRP
jgi:hypothetical protein